MKPPADDTAQIIASDTAFALGTDLFVGFEPDTPDNVVVIYDTGGGPTDYIGYRQPTIQIRSRNNDYLQAWQNINAIVVLLNSISSRTVNGTYYSAWWLQSDITFLQRDDKDRALFVTNLRSHRSS